MFGNIWMGEMGIIIFMIFVFVKVPLGLIPAFIAKNKGRDFFLWWVYGAFLFLISLIHSLIIPHEEKRSQKSHVEPEMKKCPSCAELIKKEAQLCRFCGTKFNNESTETPNEKKDSPEPQKRKIPCPECGTVLTIPKEFVGKSGRCPKCKTTVPIPAQIS